MSTPSVIGRPTPLNDGNIKVTGAIQFAGDLALPGMLHARFVTSIHAHANIESIDTSEALAIPGVVKILTADDLPDITPNDRGHLLLARGRVVFVGQPVALVLAADESTAQDAAELVFVDYEPLPVAIYMDDALAEDAPLVWPDGMPGQSEEAAAHGADTSNNKGASQKPSNVADRFEFGRGDITQGLAEADVVIERTFNTQIVHQSYLEPHATVVQPDPMTGGATVWSCTQSAFGVRQRVASVLGVPESDVKVTATPAGGAFGSKFLLYEPLVALAAQITGRPVQLVLSRLEEMLAGLPTQKIRIEGKLGAKKDGTLTALQAHITLDNGCYPSSLGGLVALLFGSLYRVQNLDLQGQEVLTFRVSGGAYRAPGAPQAAFALESMMNELAEQLEMDPLELRAHNAVSPGDLMAMGQPWPNMGLAEVLEAVQTHPVWQNRAEARAAGRGVGFALGAWPGGTEPAAASCRLNRDGILQVNVGSVDLTGTMTGFGLIAAEVFGLPPEKVRVVTSDTSTMPYAGGAGGSKITYTVGPAVIEAVEQARTQTIELAADLLEADPADLEIVDGKVQVKGVPDRGIPLGEIASKGMQFRGRYAPIYGNSRYVEPRQSPAITAQLAEVEVDAETGQVKVHRLVVIQDVGKAINPLTIKGQMVGGATQGLGWALYESMAYDTQGQLLTASFMDYNLPSILQTADAIETIILEVPSEHGPFGARGVGEPPIIPTAGAIANAITDATGLRLTDLPMTPPKILAGLTN
ncbi:MAG: xanthine dehydrogenase family protein molybdopterin-binding subunit [Chloroflexota bacterium]